MERYARKCSSNRYLCRYCFSRRELIDALNQARSLNVTCLGGDENCPWWGKRWHKDMPIVYMFFPLPEGSLWHVSISQHQFWKILENGSWLPCLWTNFHVYPGSHVDWYKGGHTNIHKKWIKTCCAQNLLEPLHLMLRLCKTIGVLVNVHWNQLSQWYFMSPPHQ